MISKHGIVFVNDTQCEHYDALVIREISDTKCIDIDLLQALGLWDDLNALLGVLG